MRLAPPHVPAAVFPFFNMSGSNKQTLARSLPRVALESCRRVPVEDAATSNCAQIKGSGAGPEAHVDLPAAFGAALISVGRAGGTATSNGEDVAVR